MKRILATQKEALTGFLFLCLLSGCASIDSSEYRQVILVKSIPPGADIIDADGNVLGRTPAFVRVRRGERPRLRLKRPGQADRELKLPTHYRWLDSGATNLVFTIFAPVGWAVDWMTGNMWYVDDPPTSEYPNLSATAGPPRDPVVAIAPPKGIEIEASDGLGNLVEENLRQEHWRVMDYQDTAPIFDYYGPSQADRYALLYQLHADRVLEGQAKLFADHLEYKAQLKDVYGEKSLREYDWEFAPQAGQVRSSLSWANFQERYLHFLPNTVFLNLSRYQARVNIDGVERVGSSARSPGVFNNILDSISYLSLSHIERPRENVKAHFTLGLVPAVFFSDKSIRFDSYAPVADVAFNRLAFGVGYGGELGFLSRYGFAYLDYIPTVTWTQISFSNPYVDENLARWSGTFAVELGYTYFLTKHLVVKLYTRTLNEDVGLWRRALNDAGGNQPEVSDLSSVFYGFSVGYYIPSSLPGGEGWKLVSQKSR